MTRAPVAAIPVPEPSDGTTRAVLEAPASATGPRVELRLPSGSVPLAIPEAAADPVVDLAETGLRLAGHPVLYARWRHDADGIPEGGHLYVAVEVPFVSGWAKVGFSPTGALTGSVEFAARIAVLGVPVARLSYAGDGFDAGAAAPFPVPNVGVDEGRLQLAVGGFEAVDQVGIEFVDPFAAAETELPGTWSVPLPPGTPQLLGFDAAQGAFQRADMAADPRFDAIAARLANQPRAAQPLPTALRSALEGLLGVDPSGVGVHVDEKAGEAAAELGAAAFTLGGEAYFAPGSFAPEAPDGIELALRAVTQALQGGAGPVPEAEPLEDPAQSESAPVPAPPAAAAAPDLEGAEAVGELAPEAVPEAEAVPEEEGAVAAEEAAAEVEEPELEPEGEAAAEPAPVELIIPPAPAAPGPAQQQRMAAVGGGARRAGAASTDLPAAEESTAAARGAVTEPDAETLARAEASLAAALGERAAPSPEIVALCERIRTSIREGRPVDEDELTETDPEGVASEAGAALNQSVTADSDRVQGEYDQINEPAEGTPQLEPTPVVPEDPSVADPGINAASARPDEIPPGDLSLDADQAQLEQQVEAANIHRPTTEPIQEEPFTTVREGQEQFAELAATSPAQVAQEQAAAIASAETDMRALQVQALEALNAARASTVTGTETQQTGMVGTEQQTREQIATQARSIFTEAQTQVNTLLAPLTEQAMNRWETGVAALSTDFRNSLNRVQRWIDERHSGVGGAIVGAWDALTGLPDWVTDEYNRAEREFGDGVCDLLLGISEFVNSIIAAAEALIASAEERIDQLFADLPEGLREWAEQERAGLQAQLDGLRSEVHDVQAGFIDDISSAAVSTVAEVQAEVEALREAARGLIGQVIAAVGAFLEDPITAIIEGLLRIVGIPPASFWALVARIQQVIGDIADDPMNFVNNLVAAVKQGFEQFFAAFPAHVLSGFWDWLFSGLGSVGVELPSDFSLQSLVTFALQIMGITWPNIREILVRHVGAENVELIEQAWEIISTFIEAGWEGLYNMVAERLNPATIIQTILDAAIDYLIETLITQVVVRVVGLLNPAGAVVQAIELIYKVLKWIFENAARIFTFVETIVNGIADIIAGNIGGMANAVELALASLIPVVIDLLAGLLGLGDLPDQIARVIGDLQAMVLSVIDRIIGWLVTQAQALLAALGVGGGPEEEEDGEEGAEDTELGTEVSFSAEGESHRQWIDLVGGDAVLMVASDAPTPVSDKLNQWQADLDRHFENSPDQRAEAAGLITAALAALSAADSEADALAAAFAAAAQQEDADVPSDEGVESGQRTLVSSLRRLFELFGGDPEAKLAEIAAAMPAHGAQRKTQAHSNWYANQISKVKRGPPTGRAPIWQESVLAGSEAAAIGNLAERATHESLLPYFITAPGERAAATGTFYSYALVEQAPAPAHPLRTSFLDALGGGAETAVRSAGTTAVPDTLISAEERTAIAEALVRMSYSSAVPPLGRFVDLPVDRPPDHYLFKPTNIQPHPQGLRYDTEAGQSFVVEVDTMGLPTKVDGAGLRLFSGRGVTERPMFFSQGQGMHSAHVIANQFGGSGFSAGANLVATSGTYNVSVMGGAERTIRNLLRDHAVMQGATLDDVVFDMSVSVTFGELTDEGALAAAAADPDIPGDSVEVLRAVIRAKLDAGQIEEKLQRVMDCRYTVTNVKVAGAATGYGFSLPSLGPDRWLVVGA